MHMLYRQLRDKLIQSGREYDLKKIEEAFTVANNAHGQQLRLTGEPYIVHPVSVASLLCDIGMDTDCICAGILHDVVEDTVITLKEIEKQFGGEVAMLVDGVTKLGQIQYHTHEDMQAENVRKMLLAMSKDIRVILIKLCDRMHNMRTLDAMRPAKQLEKSMEVMEVYAPIAHRLGITRMAEELEDIALRYLDPYGYKEIEQYLNFKDHNGKEFLTGIKEQIQNRLHEVGITENVEITSRVKSIYGIYRKVYIGGKNFEEIYDIYAIRLICNNVTQCYSLLGLVHDMYTPIPNRFKDYISTPKPNGYRSLHTTVISKEKQPFEIQIRTFDMHHQAEFGIAAHWKYKAGLQGKDKMDEKLDWIRQLLEAQQESEKATDLLNDIKSDLSSDEVFAFTPRGDVKSLPAGSTVIDFAYAIHSGVGNSMVGAKVNGRIVSLDYKIQNGEIIEILTSKAANRGPSRDWLKIVRTSEARNKIKSYFKKTQREENVLEGKIEIEREFKHNQIELPPEEMEKFLQHIAEKYQYSKIDDFYAAIGYGGLSMERLIPSIKDSYTKRYKSEPVQTTDQIELSKHRGNESGVIVEGLDNCLIKFARCCSPVPGDDIVGFVTRGFGVSVHKADCPNIIAAKKQKENEGRFVRVHWIKAKLGNFKATIEILAADRPELLADVTVAISSMRVPMYEVNARAIDGNRASIRATIGITSADHLQTIILRLGKIRGVEDVRRIGV